MKNKLEIAKKLLNCWCAPSDLEFEWYKIVNVEVNEYDVVILTLCARGITMNYLDSQDLGLINHIEHNPLTDDEYHFLLFGKNMI